MEERGIRDTLAVKVTLPADAADKRLAFPVIQSCTEGENAWIQQPVAGVGHDDLEMPAPVVEVTAAEAEDHHAAAPAGNEAAGSSGADAAAQTEVAPAAAGGSSEWLGAAGLAAELLGLAAGLVALQRTAKRAQPP